MRFIQRAFSVFQAQRYLYNQLNYVKTGFIYNRGLFSFRTMSSNKLFSDEELRKKLTPEQYDICVNKGTEVSFTGEYDKHKAEGIYKCVVCGHDLFASEHKYNSGCGWPSFYKAQEHGSKEDSVCTAKDDSIEDRPRVEIMCQKCNSHLGHVFEDGPQPTGLRYCVNSASISFQGKQDN